MKPLLLLFFFNFFKTPYAAAQDTLSLLPALKHTTITNAKKQYVVAGIHAAAYAGTLAVLSTTWYNGYAKTRFHTFNDGAEWLQLDKAGHLWTAFNIAAQSAWLWRWSGVAEKKAAVLGGASALGYQTILELLDAHSAQWGWSWADMGANAAGAALYTTQQLTWSSEKIVLKFSSTPQRYEASLRPRADALFGNTFAERLLKDYNGQTYWLSVNLQTFSQAHIPAWLNLAVGYGAQGLYGGFENIAVDKTGAIVFDRRDIPRVRQWYLSPDVDWTKIKTNKKIIRTLFSLMNMIKIPAPAVQLSRGKLKAKWLQF